MNEEQSLAKLSELIPDVATVVTVKYSITSALADNEKELWDAVKDRIEFCSMWLEKEIGLPEFMSVGLHLDGIRGKPHVHIHYIIPVRFQLKTASARSNSKVRFIQSCIETEGMDWESINQNLTFKFAPLDLGMPKWQTLAYPLKERHRSPEFRHYYHFMNGVRHPMSPVLVNALENVGGAIFDAARGVRERQEAYKARKLNNLEEMYKFAVENRSKFKTFREMREFFEVELLGSDVPIAEIPVIKNYNNNVFIVGKKLGLVRYCDYDP